MHGILEKILSGMGAEKQNKVIEALLDNYRGTHFDKDKLIVNTMIDRPVFIRLFPDLEWDNSDQVVDGVYFMSSGTSGKVMKHHGIRSWADLPEYHISGGMKIKRVLRNPAIFKKLESSGLGRKILPVYTFLSYDLLDMGPLFFIKLFIRKFRKKK